MTSEWQVIQIMSMNSFLYFHTRYIGKWKFHPVNCSMNFMEKVIMKKGLWLCEAILALKVDPSKMNYEKIVSSFVEWRYEEGKIGA